MFANGNLKRRKEMVKINTLLLATLLGPSLIVDIKAICVTKWHSSCRGSSNGMTAEMIRLSPVSRDTLRAVKNIC